MLMGVPDQGFALAGSLEELKARLIRDTARLWVSTFFLGFGLFAPLDPRPAHFFVGAPLRQRGIIVVRLDVWHVHAAPGQVTSIGGRRSGRCRTTWLG
jgi:hypothetical protein